MQKYERNERRKMRYKRQGMGDGGLEIRDRRLKAAQFIFVFFLLDKKVTINILSDLYEKHIY